MLKPEEAPWSPTLILASGFATPPRRIKSRSSLYARCKLQQLKQQDSNPFTALPMPSGPSFLQVSAVPLAELVKMLAAPRVVPPMLENRGTFRTIAVRLVNLCVFSTLSADCQESSRGRVNADAEERRVCSEDRWACCRRVLPLWFV